MKLRGVNFKVSVNDIKCFFEILYMFNNMVAKQKIKMILVFGAFLCLEKDGVEQNGRFFYEEPGHLRRLTSEDFTLYEKKIGFELKKEFYSNQKDGAINWITKASPRFVKRLTDPTGSNDEKALKKMRALRKKLLPLTYFQFPYAKFLEIKNKWNKTPLDYVKLITFFFPALVSLPFYKHWDKKAAEEWQTNKTNRNGSEMFLYFIR